MVWFFVFIVILLIAVKRQRDKKAAAQSAAYAATARNEPGYFKRLGRAILGATIAFMFFVLLVGGISEKEPTDSPTDSTPRVTDTAKGTNTPKPTATSAPDFDAMHAEAAVRALAEYYENPSITFDSVMELDGLVNVQARITNEIWDERMAVQRVCQYVLRIAQHAFENSAVDSLVFYFDSELRDMYGNLDTSRVCNINISRATAEKINYDWMIDRVYISTKEVLAVFDDYTVHPSLSNGLN